MHYHLYTPTRQSLPATQQHFRQIRNQFTLQVSQIEEEYLFAQQQPRRIRPARRPEHNPNPEPSSPSTPLSPTKLSVTVDSKDIGSAHSSVSAKSAQSSNKRRNTFLTVVSRLPSCKKRSESMW